MDTFNSLHFFLLFCLLVLVYILKVQLNKKKAHANNNDDAKTETSIGKSKITPKRPLSKPEQVLYYSLSSALPDMIILPQVSFDRFLFSKGGSKSENFRKRGTYSQKAIDYLVCDKSFFIVAAIELDDSSHTPEKDAKKDAILKEAKIRLVRWNVNSLPSKNEIQRAIQKSG